MTKKKMTGKKVKSFLQMLCLNFFFIFICLIGLIPILYALFLSFQSGSSALSAGNGIFHGAFTFENYKDIILHQPLITWLLNSLELSIGTMILAISFSVTCAYAFSRYRFKGRIQTLRLLLILNAFPQILTMFALFRLFKTLHLLDSKLGLILIYAGSMCIFAVLNMKGYFDTIPVEIEEAAKIDGATEGKLMAKIIFPLARPSIIVTAVMVLIFVWNEYLFATTFLLKANSYTLAGGLYQLQANDYSRSWPLFTAAAILVSIPILIVFFVVQKHMISGLTSGGVKG